MIGAQGYERHLAGAHTAHRRGWFDFHPGHLCAVDGVSPLAVSLLTTMGAAVQKKSNSWRFVVIAQMIEAQGYERHLANPLVDQVNHLAGSHTAHRRGRFDFHPGHLCAVDGDSPYCGLASDSDG
jgi:hypothetical protein